MKALESFEIQSWNALWVFKYKIQRQQISVHCNTTIHDKAENLKIQHINSYLFLRTATYNSLANSLSRVTFDLIPCPEQNAWTEIDEKPKQQNRYLCNIYIHAQDRKNFREFSLKIKTHFRSTLYYFVKRIDKRHVFQHHTVFMYANMVKNVFWNSDRLHQKYFYDTDSVSKQKFNIRCQESSWLNKNKFEDVFGTHCSNDLKDSLP